MRQRNHKGNALGAVVALSLGALLLVACAHKRIEVVEHNHSPINQTVTVKGEVDRPLGPGIFVFDSDELKNEDTLVLYQSTEPAVTLHEGDDVRVTGKLESMSLAELQQRYSISLPQKIVERFDGQPVFLAQRVEVTDRER